MRILILSILSLSAYADYEGKINLGERLFSDPRFSQVFYRAASDINDEKAPGKACISCHQVDAKFDPTSGLGMRTYSDSTPKTKIPLRLSDKTRETLRNTPALVGIGSKYMKVRISHWDGEFGDHSETVMGNFLGRNQGWLPAEKQMAKDHIVNILKNDNGLGELAQEFGGAYQKVLLGVDPSLPDELRLKPADRIDVMSADQDDILSKLTDYVTAYLNDLDFEKDEDGNYIGSPYDQFLLANGLPTVPAKRQTVHEYMIELRKGFTKLTNPKFIAKKYFATHGREFGFGPQEYEGLKVFFNLPKADGSLNQSMCLSCHKPPMFTDQKFHNVGTSQLEYDRVHGRGSFNQLQIPEPTLRSNMMFNKPATKEDPQAADLGVWNFFGRKKEITAYMRSTHCSLFEDCTNDKVLPLMVGKFKTPSLRNLNHSAPYFHNGSSQHLFHLLHEYKRASNLMRAGELRNGAVQLRGMKLFHHEIHSLVPFLESLNEEYDKRSPF